ncbi:hypothetical protein [Kitasatospora sp. NPDC097643]|uniref:hypothetical protein n=1 Tax=Kitasatospora sp. NPDC097643 TaxID=3157230 RepID=UPI00332FE711
MRVPKILSSGVLLICPVLGLAAASPAVAAETSVAVKGPVSSPGGPSRATCPEHTHLTGGGYEFTPAGPNDTVVANGPDSSAPNSWIVRASHGNVTAVAVCETED